MRIIKYLKTCLKSLHGNGSRLYIIEQSIDIIKDYEYWTHFDTVQHTTPT